MNNGIKANNLIELRSLYPNNVPPFEVVHFEEVIDAHGAIVKKIEALIREVFTQDIQNTNGFEEQIRQISESIKINEKALLDLQEKIIASGWTKISLRTSALLEDGEKQSFAGQYVSFLDVPVDNVKQLRNHIRACFQSLFSLRVINYAKSHRLKTFKIGGSVIVQKMFYGKKSGVLFTEDGHGNMTFAFTDSWRNTTVDGYDATVIKLPKMALDAPRAARQIKEIAKIGVELDKRYGKPLDIEWSYDTHTVMLLQMRPQTTETTEYSLTWDATNISENYPNITLPLTYSFIKNLYACVYPSFFRIMGMSKKKLEQNSWIFDNALGYIHGRIYYRIENWYELVKLIPGQRNQEFFEAMLNPVKKRVKSGASSTRLKAVLNPGLWLLTLRFTWILLRSDAYSRSFSKKFASKFEQYKNLDWSSMTAEASLDRLREIRSELLVLWGIPILNDIRVMIFHGIFKAILFKDDDHATYLNHLKGLSDQASIKPLEALYELGKRIDETMVREKITRIEDLETTEAWSDIKSSAITFMDEFGGRTPDELQLENPRLSENLWDILNLSYASKDADLNVSKPSSVTPLKNFPIYKRPFARFVIRNVRRAIDYRERFRFNRAQVFGIARTAYLSIGEKLTAAGVIKHQEDVFWLTEQEIESIVRGHSWSYDLSETVFHRKKEYDEYDTKPFWLRVSGKGAIAPTSVKNAVPKSTSTHGISGNGVAPGKVTGQVVVVNTFDPKLDITNKILVVRHIDPGWTLLLVQAAGVITEQGNPLSHVAIVAREISIPAIVGVKDAVTTFKTGDTVTIDGTIGEIVYES